MNGRVILAGVLWLSVLFGAWGQAALVGERVDDAFPKDYFDPPLRLPMEFSASFAELRPNHFHSGMDIRIGNKIGAPVYAPADGWVSRVAISPWGGGQVLYITHANGFRTVYMHLEDFAGAIGEWVRKYQYEHRVYAFDAAPEDTIFVHRGQLIAHAGNTGASGGPHLHYDIRYAHNDQPINPLYFGLKYEDDIAPTIRDVRVYPVDGGTVQGKETAFALWQQHKNKQGKVVSRWADTVSVRGAFYTGVYATDVSKGSPGKNGVESVELWVDDTLFFRYCVPTFLFEETRAINAIIDYAEYVRSRRAFVITRQLKGNKNHFCQSRNGTGVLTLAPGKHRLEYVAADYKGNKTRRAFWVRVLPGAVKEAQGYVGGIDMEGEAVSYFKRHVVQRPGFVAEIETGTLYDNDFFHYSYVERQVGLLSGRHTLVLQRHALPPHKAYTLRLPLPAGDTALQARMVVVSVDGKRLTALPTTRRGQELVATARVFGSFGVAVDTVAPTLRAVNFKAGGALPAGGLVVKVGDDLSGLEHYHCYVNGQWVLSRYDGKTSTLQVQVAEVATAGRNEVLFLLTDGVGNSSRYSFLLHK